MWISWLLPEVSARALGPVDWSTVRDELGEWHFEEERDGVARRMVELGDLNGVHPESVAACRRACERRGYALDLDPGGIGWIVEARP